MRDILPEKVRTRVGKPGTGDYLAWSLANQEQRLEHLITRPLLADLGIVEPAALRAAFHGVLQRTRGIEVLCSPLVRTLAVEMWLRIRSGRWPVAVGDVA